jgi:hypothetical protein
MVDPTPTQLPSMRPDQLHAWFLALEERVRSLRAEIANKQAELAREDEQLSLVRRLFELQNGNAASSQTAAPPRQDSTAARSTTSPDLETAVEEVLRAEGSPLHISTIRSRLIERGVPIPGRGDDANIIVRIGQQEDRFTRTARGTYALTEWGLPAMPRVARRKKSKPRRK